ncbi:MAG: efflux RND transporter permease subunit [Saprospiraceae bacterium]|nr:efflux RND transporter permease subunit [Saprospiraceae bacterium]MDP4698980.1 efflux RND transporter permease subunit [Saprospiraceae bacterium]MDP4811363.1 efflux RND transporter permease subunit [Saprospiraceae bacterium]MDP4814445.1 efflux RND transporter permease subunit [Saprospiraceae bacterium]MDP5049286.1 efflux RND transporter permease subunit [Saprospiraceae bacterium]
MRITDFAVKNYPFTLIVFLLISVIGAFTVINMPRAEDPELNAPIFPVTIIYPGTSPVDIEELVIKPMEKALYGLENIRRLKSIIGDGYAVIRVEFKYGVDVNEKYQELVRELASLKGKLPSDMDLPTVEKVSPSNVNVIQTALISETATWKQLKMEADKLAEALEKIPALKNIEIAGLPEEQIQISLDFERMARLGVSQQAVINNLQSELANIPSGSIDVGNRYFNVKSSGNFREVEEIKNTLVYSANNRNVQLRDIANVSMTFAERDHITRLNGHRGIFVVAAQKSKENIAATQLAYQPILEKFKKSLPSNIDMIHHFDQAEVVQKRLSGLGFDFIWAILLVAFTLLPLGFRPAIIVMISIPLSLSIGIIILNYLGFSLNQLSIVGLVVALGLLVDDSIVVIENIERWMLNGYSRKDAVLKATSQIGTAVLGCTATLIIAFLPLIFLPEASGEFIRSLPISVIASVLASLLVSLTIIPFLGNILLKKTMTHSEGNWFMRVLKSGISKSYAPILEISLNNPVKTMGVILIVFFASLQLMPIIGFSLFPASEKPQFLIRINPPAQVNIKNTDTISRFVEKELTKISDVQFYATNVGMGNPQIYYNEIRSIKKPNFAEIFVQLDPATSVERKLFLIDSLRNEWTPFHGAKVQINNFEQGPPVVAPVEVRLLGDNLDSLRALSFKIENLIKSVPGTIYVNNPVSNLQTDLRVKINKEKAALLGVPTISIDKTLRLALAGIPIGIMSDDDGEDYQIIIKKKENTPLDLDVFKTLFVENVKGKAIPLTQFAHLELESSPLSINHLDKTRMVSISAFVSKGYLNDEVIKKVMDKLDQFSLPSGYTYQMGGEYETRQESFSGFTIIIILTIFLFIGILLLEFKTFKSTIIVLSVIPLGMVGALAALWLTGNSLSFVAVVGLIALAGIEIKNTILLVDFTNQLREEGKPLDIAIREAGEIRFLPIILTSLTAIGGLIPIALSTNPLISPLAIVLIGGLISSTLLSRIFTPVIYKLIPPKMES